MSTSKSGSSQAEIDLAVFLDDKPPATKSGVDDFCIEFMLYYRCVFHMIRPASSSPGYQPAAGPPLTPMSHGLDDGPDSARCRSSGASAA
jgi:hypothetical protein